MVLGKEHPNTLSSLRSLAMILLSQGKYEDAEEMSRRALELNEKVPVKVSLSIISNSRQQPTFSSYMQSGGYSSLRRHIAIAIANRETHGASLVQESVS
jgi:hypothetical protein